jgi:hypothetical protein
MMVMPFQAAYSQAHFVCVAGLQFVPAQPGQLHIKHYSKNGTSTLGAATHLHFTASYFNGKHVRSL